MSIGAYLQKDRFKCLEMKELNDTEKFTSQVLFKFVVSQDTFIQIAFSRSLAGPGVKVHIYKKLVGTGVKVHIYEKLFQGLFRNYVWLFRVSDRWL